MITPIKIPFVCLADDDSALKAKREELKKKLLEGKKIPISPTGSVTTGTNEGAGISIPPGKLAMNQWYEKSPLLLEAEKAERERELDEKRESQEPKNEIFRNQNQFLEYNTLKQKEAELLQTIPPSLNQFYKNKVNEYFNNFN